MSPAQRLKRLERFRTAGDQVIISLRMLPDEAVVAARVRGRLLHRRPDETIDALYQRAIATGSGQGLILIDYLNREQAQSERAPGESACDD